MFVTKIACLLIPFVFTVDSAAINPTQFDVKSSKGIISTKLTKRDVIVKSLMECASQCSSYDFCETASFDSETTSCNLSTSCNPETLVSPTATFIRKRRKQEFKPVFEACSGNGQSVLDTWRTPSMGGDIVNINDSCTTVHLRSSVIDNWNGSIIDQKKGEGLDPLKRLIPLQMFAPVLSQESDVHDQTVDRHFYISSSYGGCPEDTIWMIVVDTTDANYRPCFYDNLSEREYPYILYGPGQHKAKLSDGTFAVADKMVIPISTIV